MTDFNQFHDSFTSPPQPAKKMPDMINVLTILTFIYCAYEVFNSILGFLFVCKKSLADENEKLANTPFAGLFSSLQDTMIKSCEMRVPLLIVNLLGPLLCFFGALQMRKLKRSGFFVYLIGELSPLVAMLIILGMGIMFYISLFFSVIFIILYATQVKHLKK